MAARDPAAALNLAAAQPPGYARESAYAVMARGLAATDPAGALKALGRIGWPQAEASNEIKWSIQFGGDPTFSGDAQAEPGSAPAFEALQELMRTAPGPTASALAALPPEAGAPVAPALGAWMAQDPESASGWLRDQPAGPVKNAGIDLLAHWLVEEAPQPDYEAAAAWAESSTGPEREKLVQWVVKQKELSEKPPGAVDAFEAGFRAAGGRKLLKRARMREFGIPR